MNQAIEKDFELGRVHKNTNKKEKSVYKLLSEFKPKIPFTDLDIDLIDRFKKWRTQNGISSTTINSNMRIIKKYIGRAEDDGIKMKIKKTQIKVGSTLGSREALNNLELKKMMQYYNAGFIKDGHKIPLCRFLFSCYSGMRIGDNQNLTNEKIQDGRIYFRAQKNKREDTLSRHCWLATLFAMGVRGTSHATPLATKGAVLKRLHFVHPVFNCVLRLNPPSMAFICV